MTEITLTRRIARQALDRRSRIPADVAAKVRLNVADAIGIALAGRRESPLASQAPESFPPALAFRYSALMHVLDYDDIHDAARLHPTTVTLSAALAAAQACGASMTEVRTAVALGNELMCRMGLMWKPSGSGPGSDWFLTQLVGYFAAALTAGLVMGFDEDALVSALGLAYMQAAGGKEAGFGVGSNARSIYPAFAAMGGVQAALLARGGIDGPATALEGAAGLFHIYFGRQPGREALELLIDPEAWQFRATQAKPWPCCRLSHPYVAAAFALRDKLPNAPITRVVARVNASAAKLCRPIESRRIPQTLQDAKYSIPFMTAFALVHGRADLAVLNPAAVNDSAVLALAKFVEIEESLPDGPGHPPAVIVVEAGGKKFESPVGRPPVLDEAGIRAKFEECLLSAGLDPRGAWEELQQEDRLSSPPGEKRSLSPVFSLLT